METTPTLAQLHPDGKYFFGISCAVPLHMPQVVTHRSLVNIELMQILSLVPPPMGPLVGGGVYPGTPNNRRKIKTHMH